MILPNKDTNLCVRRIPDGYTHVGIKAHGRLVEEGIPVLEYDGLHIARSGNEMFIWQSDTEEWERRLRLLDVEAEQPSRSILPWPLEDAKHIMFAALLSNRLVVKAVSTELPEHPTAIKIELWGRHPQYGAFWLKTYFSAALICEDPLVSAELLDAEINDMVRRKGGGMVSESV